MGSPEKKNASDMSPGMERVSKKNSLIHVLSYADWIDTLLMLLGAIGAIGDGMSTNCLLLFASGLMNSLGYAQDSSNFQGKFMDEVEKYSLYFVYLGLAVLLVSFMEGYCWSKTSERQVLKIRHKYLEAVLRQEVGFFDSQEATTSEIINGISRDAFLIQEVLSEKVPLFLMHGSVFVSGLAFSTYFSWRLAVVAFPTLSLLLIPGVIYGKYLLILSRKSYEEYAKANTIVEQALSSIKTVYSFTAEKNIIDKYSAILEKTERLGIKQGVAKGLAVGSTGLSFVIWAFLAWYGSRLVMNRGESGGRIYAAGVSFILSGLSLGMALPEMKHFTEASVAATRIIERIDRIPKIDAEDETGFTVAEMQGMIEFDRVSFAYPSRPDSDVLKDFSLTIEAGKTLALVGHSGSGKSTAITLIQRFYDPNSGVVRIDGFDIRTMQLKWLREKMGLVSQDHALFGTSIKENIMFGKEGATMDETIAAASAANAHQFISQLPEGYETKIGERGSLLSGGQKQRIAIARAIIKNPTILLLDEATSALDGESENIVQSALELASMGRTTLVVAHKLSTVLNADQIAVIDKGSIVEIGTNSELLNKNGHYAKLAQLQRQFSSLGTPNSQPCSARNSTPRLNTRASPLGLASPEIELSSSKRKPSRIPPSFGRLLALNSPEWKEALLGSLSAAAYGSIQPVYALTIGGMISAFFTKDRHEMEKRIRLYTIIFSTLSLLSIVFNLIQHYHFAYMGEKLTKRVRLRMLNKILSFEPAWFDQEGNSSGSLCAMLSQEASMVKSLVADRLSLLVQTASGVTVAMIMGLIIAWKLALVMIAVQPLTILCFYARKVLLSTTSKKFANAQNQSAQLAIEAVCNHKIVTSFSCISKVLKLFDEAQAGAKREARKKAWLAGIGMGTAQCLTFVSWALDFWYGGVLVKKGEISAGDVFKTFFILVSTGKVIGEAGSMTSDVAKGSAAVASVFDILDRSSTIPGSFNAREDGMGAKLSKLEGRIEMVKVDFSYPTRPGSWILREFSLKVKPGTSVGVVGKSGCGKSTVIGLIQRFYEADRGIVKIDDVDIRNLDVGWYRTHTALVSQEPVIYSGTIRDNILLGRHDAAEDEVVGAARSANAHEFISALKDGYNTECGERGVQLSGGQKQRIAIARAIIRNPAILLLDEATSALDIQSEQIVKQALDEIMIGRTTIIVAHRLNTIKNVDTITVVEEGKIVQSGSYAQLKSHKGAFFRLVAIQDIGLVPS